MAAVCAAGAILAIVATASVLFARLGAGSPDRPSAVLTSTTSLHDYAAEEIALIRLLAKEPQNLEARRTLARALAAQGKNQEAIKQYRSVAKADAKDDASLYALATLEQLTGDAQASIGHYEAALAVKPKSEYLAALAPVYATVGRWDDCIRTWEQYLEAADVSAPQQGSIYAAIATAYENAHQYDKAKEALAQALSLEPTNEQYRARLEGYGQ